MAKGTSTIRKILPGTRDSQDRRKASNFGSRNETTTLAGLNVPLGDLGGHQITDCDDEDHVQNATDAVDGDRKGYEILV